MAICPHCSTEFVGPIISYAQLGQWFRTTRDCPSADCARPLVFWKDGPLANGQWQADEGEERRRRHAAGDL